MARNIYGLDLGTYEIKIFDKKKVRIWREKNVIAMKDKKYIFSVGNEAYKMYEKAPENVEILFPMKNGVIARFDDMQYLLGSLLKTDHQFARGAEYVIAVPTDVTEVEKKAFYDLVMHSEAKAKSVGSQINLISNVREAKFVSRQQALDEFIDTQNDAALFDGIEADTLRDRFVVTLEDNSLITQTKEMLKQIDGVDEVSAHDEIANGFQTVQKVLNIAAMVIIVVLFVVSMFIISNTIKLAMYSRSQEIAIMKMVGATNSFIRLPFVVEGLILGFISSLVAFFLEWGLYDFLASKIAQIDTLQLITIVPFAECIEFVAIAYAITGFVVGVFGSMLSIRKFLRV